MTSTQKKEYTLRISRANKSGLVVILYEMLLAYLQDAYAAMQKKDTDSCKREIENARDCLKELLRSLDYEYELAQTLRELYFYVNHELKKAQADLDEEHLQRAERVIKKLCFAYQQASKEDQSAALMSNVQTVHAGFTYGKHDVCESLDDKSANRGFLV